MYPRFQFFLFWLLVLDFAKAQELALNSDNGALNLNSDSNINSISLDSNCNDDASSSSIPCAISDSVDTIAQSPDSQSSDRAKLTLSNGGATSLNDGSISSNDGATSFNDESTSSNDGAAPLNNVATPSHDGVAPISPDNPTQPYTVAQLGESLFNPGEGLAGGIETLWGIDSAIFQAEGEIIRSGAIGVQGITIYFVQRKTRKTHRRTRKINGVKKDDGRSVSNQELQNAILNLKCPDLGNWYPLTKVCKTRSGSLPRYLYTIGHFTNHAVNVIPVVIDQVFNTAIFGINHLLCYCCRAMVKSLDETRFDGKGCQVVMYT